MMLSLSLVKAKSSIMISDGFIMGFCFCTNRFEGFNNPLDVFKCYEELQLVASHFAVIML